MMIKKSRTGSLDVYPCHLYNLVTLVRAAVFHWNMIVWLFSPYLAVIVFCDKQET